MATEAHIKTAPLTALERNRFEGYERTISESVQTFMEVGEALAAIRNEKLYRDQFDTFEDYCRERWGITDSRARQLTTASKVAAEIHKALPEVTVPNEKTARAINSVPPEKRTEVVEQAAKSGGLSPKSVESARDEIIKAGPPPKKKTKKAEPLIDPAGREYSDPKVMQALGQTTDFDKLKAAVHQLKKQVIALADRPVGKELDAKQIRIDFENIAAAIRHATPYTTCPYLRSHGDRGCELCDGEAWVTKPQFERVPEEDR